MIAFHQTKLECCAAPPRGSTFVMIGQNRQAAFQKAKAEHDFIEQELELKTNTEITRAIHTLTTELHRRIIDDGIRPT